MAKSKLTADIPKVGLITVEGNHATEESIQELISLMGKQKKISNKQIEDFNDSINDAADDIDEFSDSIEDSVKKQDAAAKKLASFADTSADATMGLQKFADSGGSLSSAIDSVGEVIIGVGRGLGGMVPFIGEGLEELTGAAATAAVGLTSMAVGMIEGFQGLNKQIFNSGLQVQGGFATFADYANDAKLPINEFANAMLLSSDRMRLFAGAAPGGIQQVSKALKDMSENGIMENLYSLGFTTEEVVAGMADYAIAAERQGKVLSTAELAEGSTNYLKNLRELGRITGTSVKEAQAQIEADRSNLFVQRELLKVAPEQRAAAAAFAAQLDAIGLGPMKDFIIGGQSMSTQSGIMSSQMATTATVLQNAYQQVAAGNVAAENTSAFLRDSLKSNGIAITAELENLINMFGQTPDLAQQFGDLGSATRGVTEMVNAANTDQSGGTEIEPGSIQENLGKFEATLNSTQASIQNVFVESLEATSPILGKLADAGKLAADNLNEFVDALAGGNLKEYFENLREEVRTQAYREATGGTRGKMQSDRVLNLEMDRFVKDPNSFTNEEKQDLINTLRGKQREDSNAFVQLFGSVSGALSDSLGNLDALVTSDEAILKSIEALRNSKPSDGYATGGVASGPKSGYDVELHGTEAVVPLPDGNSIPVSLNTSGMNSMISSIVETIVNQTKTDDNAETTKLDMTTSLDSSKTLSEMLQVNKNMLKQMMASSQKTDDMLRAMENANLISRNSAYSRA